jgi:hypothetical protein
MSCLSRIWSSLLFTAAIIAMPLPLAAAQSKAKGTEGVIPVKINATINRTWKQVQDDKFVYGPKQEVDNDTNETHVWLPYGKDTSLYHEVQGVLSDPGEVGNNGRSTLINPQDASTTCSVTYKVVFNKPITSFRFTVGWQELNLGEKSAAGIEYSLNGKKWVTIQETKGSDPGATGFKMSGVFGKDMTVKNIVTQQLFLRVYARDAQNSEDRHGDTRWLRLILSGDPAWGDAERTFFAAQPQLWVAAGKK